MEPSRAAYDVRAGAITAVVADFLASALDPERGGDLYDAHATAAVLLVGGAGVSREQVERAAYAQAHALAGGDAAPRLELGELLSLAIADEANPPEALAWFGVRDCRPEPDLALAVGLSYERGAWRLAWYDLARSIQPWTWAMGRSQMLAEFAFVSGVEHPRTWLDVSYYRQRGLPTPPLTVLPEARFSCQMSGVCCRIDFQVKLEPPAQDFLDAVPWEELAPDLADTRLPVLPDGLLLLKNDNETCRFMDAQRHCMIHKHYGRAVFAPCAVFPYRFAPTPDGSVAVTTYTLCGSARHNLGDPLAAHAADVHYRLALDTHRTPDTFSLAARRPVDWEVFKATEHDLLAILAREELPLTRRLWCGGRLLENRLADESLDAATARAWEVEEIAPLSAGAATELTTLFATALPVLAGDVLPLLTALSPTDEAVLTRALRNLVFGKAYSFLYDLVTAHNLLVVAYLVARVEIAAAPENSPRPWQTFGHLTEQSPQLAGLPLLFGWPDRPGGIASPAFGLHLLRYAATPG